MTIPGQILMPALRGALSRGQRVRLVVTGGSMTPFIGNGDVVEMQAVFSPPKVGDILFVSQRNGWEERYVLHRVVRIKEGGFFLRGDGQRHLAGPYKECDVVAKATRVFRAGRAYRLDKGLWRAAGRAWSRMSPACFEILRLIGHVRRLRATV